MLTAVQIFLSRPASRPVSFCGEKFANRKLLTIFFKNTKWKYQKTDKKCKEDEQTLADLSSAHRRSQGIYMSIRTCFIKRINKVFLITNNKQTAVINITRQRMSKNFHLWT